MTSKVLLIDLDGTLVDTTIAVERAWRRAANHLGVPFSQLAPFVHRIPAERVLARAVPELDESARLALGLEILHQQADPAFTSSQASREPPGRL